MKLRKTPNWKTKKKQKRSSYCFIALSQNARSRSCHLTSTIVIWLFGTTPTLVKRQKVFPTKLNAIRQKCSQRCRARNPRLQEKRVSAAVPLIKENVCGANYNVLPRRWALKQLKGSKPFSPNVKNYLEARFLAGEKTGHKADSTQVVADMRTTRNKNVYRLFARNEW